MKREDLLDLNDVLQHPGRQLAVDVTTELPNEEDVDLIKPLDGYIEAVSTGNILLITGKFTTTAVLECARCVGPLEVDIEFEIDEQFPIVGIASSLNPQDSAKVSPDEPFELFEGNSLLVENLLRQTLLLAMPIQPLCEFGWDGDCPKDIADEVQVAKSGRPEFAHLNDILSKSEDKD